MHVAVEKTGQHHAAVQIDHARLRTAFLRRRIAWLVPTATILPPFDGHRLADGEVRIRGDDLAVVQNEVGVGAVERERPDEKERRNES